MRAIYMLSLTEINWVYIPSKLGEVTQHETFVIFGIFSPQNENITNRNIDTM